ncbi:class I SAM-dependent methyltransferase [Aquimarina rhabdastrellae]
MTEGMFDRKNHWENIYQNKQLENVSWYQPKPTTSLELITELSIAKNAKIIDIGGGDSFLVDHLLALGYEHMTVLDISEAAIERAKKRLGYQAEQVTWIVADATTFETSETYDVWHDRAAFHFLTNDEDIKRYITNVDKALCKEGRLILGTFSTSGPLKCSGIPIKQYSIESMTKTFDEMFEKQKGFNIDHKTPFDTIQNFTFCTFSKK